MADRKLPGVGKAGLTRSPRIALQHGHLVTSTVEIPGRSRTDDTGTQNDYPHPFLLGKRT